jgi:multidrug resistance efflux pump
VVGTTGNVVADRQVSLAFATSGEIASVHAEKGQRVQAGEVLAEIDTTSLEWQVTRAQASLETAQARLAQASQPASDEEIASARASLDSALANLARVEDGATAEELASAQAAFDSARANYDKVEAGPTAEELASAQAQVESARAALHQAQASYDRVKDRPDIQMRPEALQLEQATIEYERAMANYELTANRPTQSELAAASAQVAQAEAQLATVQQRPTDSELATAAAQVAQAEAQLAALEERPRPEDLAISQAQVQEATVTLEQARSQLVDATLVAPFDGTVLAVNVRAGEWASPGAPAVTLAATDTLILAVNVDEVDVAYMAEGQSAHLRFNALKEIEDGRANGTVTYIATSSTNVGGAVAYPVEIAFDPGTLPVRLGMTAEVDVAVARADDALLVPNRAVEADREAGRYYVTRQNPDGSVSRLEVRIGLRDQAQTQIVEGVREGDVLVLPQVTTSDSAQGMPGPGMFGGMRQDGGGGQ